MTHVFVMTNHKGGVGKSTTATNTAFGIVRLLHNAGAPNNRVLLIDTDSQGHATLITAGRKNFGRDDSLYSVITADRSEAATVLTECIIQSTWDEDLHVLPAAAVLEDAERELIGVPGAPYRLSAPLKQIIQHYAAVVIDTRPSFSLLTEMGLLAATDAIIPIEPRYLESVGLQSVVNKILDIREGWQHLDLQVSGIVITKMDRRMRGHMQMVEKLRAHPVLGNLICGIIPANEAVAYAHQSHVSVYAYDPGSPASQAYAQLVKRLVRQIVVKEGA